MNPPQPQPQATYFDRTISLLERLWGADPDAALRLLVVGAVCPDSPQPDSQRLASEVLDSLSYPELLASVAESEVHPSVEPHLPAPPPPPGLSASVELRCPCRWCAAYPPRLAQRRKLAESLLRLSLSLGTMPLRLLQPAGIDSEAFCLATAAQLAGEATTARQTELLGSWLERLLIAHAERIAPWLVPGLVSVLESGPRWRLGGALVCLSLLGSHATPALRPAASLLADHDPTLVVHAAFLLGHIGVAARPSRGALRSLHRHPSQGVRRAADHALDLLATGACVCDSCARLEEGPVFAPYRVAAGGAAWARACSRLAELEVETRLGVLLVGVFAPWSTADGFEEVALECLDPLRGLPRDLPGPLPLGLESLSPPLARCAHAAWVLLLREFHRGSVDAQLREAGFDPDEVREAMFHPTEPQVEPWFAWLLEEQAPALAPWILDGTPRVLGGAEADTAFLAARALACLGPQAEPAVANLIAQLGEQSPRRVCAAARALGAIGPGAWRAVPTLRRLEGQAQPWVHREARCARQRIQLGGCRCCA